MKAAKAAHVPGTLGDAADDADAVRREEQEKARAAAMNTSAHRASIKQFSAAVESLVQLMGAQLTAYIGMVEETRAVRKWIEGTRMPSPFIQAKIGLALHVAKLLQMAGDEAIIGAWFQGLNPALEDRSPAELLHDAKPVDLSKVGREVLAAAREFISSSAYGSAIPKMAKTIQGTKRL